MPKDMSLDLRAMVREVLRETMAAPVPRASGTQRVTIASEADLQTFVARLIQPGVVEQLRAGTLRFTLSSSAPATAPAASAALDGVITERKLQSLAPGALVELAASAILTPLARDVARRLGIKFERMGS